MSKAREGRIYQPEPGRGRPWAYCVDVNPPGAKRRQKRRKGFGSQREARQALDAVLVDIADTGTDREPSRQPFGVFLAEWLDAIAPTVRPTTLHGYRQKLESHVIPRLGDRPLRSIDAGTLNGLYAELLATGNLRDGGGLSARTTRHVHKVVHRALRDAVKWGRLTHNPAEDADPPRATSTDMAVWTPDQLRTFLASVEDHDLFALWLLAVTTGMRRGELLGLRWTDLDLDGGSLSIQQTLVTVGYKTEFSAPKTKASRRQVALDRGTVAALREHRTRQLEQRLLLGAGWPDNDLVFCRADGALIHPQTLSFWFDRAVESSGLPRLSFHGIRHSSATAGLAAGVHPKVMMERLGHSSISVTLDLYSHVAPGMQEDAAERVAALVGAVL